MSKQLFKDSLIYGAGDFLFKFISFIVFPIYANVFTVEEFGIMNLIATITGFFAIFLNIGMNNSVSRYYWDEKDNVSYVKVLTTTGIGILTANSIIITLILIVITTLISSYLKEKYSIDLYLINVALLSNIFNQIIQYCLDITRLKFKPLNFLFLSALKNLSSIILSFILILGFNQKLEGYFNSLLYSLILILPVALYIIRDDIGLSFDIKLGKKLIGFGYPYIFAGLAYWLFSSMDRIMLAELSKSPSIGIYNIGLYSIANKFSTIVMFVTNAFGQSWSPLVMKLVNEDSEYKEKFGKIFTQYFFILSFLGITLSIFASEILMITTPKNYWDAKYCMVFSIMGMVISGTTQVTAIGIGIEQKTKLLSTLAWITALVNFLFNFILIPDYGANGSAFATLISYSVLTLSYLYWTQKLHPIKLELKKLNLLVLNFIALTIISILINSSNWSISIFVFKIILCMFVLNLSVYLKILDVSKIKRYLKGKFSK